MDRPEEIVERLYLWSKTGEFTGEFTGELCFVWKLYQMADAYQFTQLLMECLPVLNRNFTSFTNKHEVVAALVKHDQLDNVLNKLDFITDEVRSELLVKLMGKGIRDDLCNIILRGSSYTDFTKFVLARVISGYSRTINTLATQRQKERKDVCSHLLVYCEIAEILHFCEVRKGSRKDLALTMEWTPEIKEWLQTYFVGKEVF